MQKDHHLSVAPIACLYFDVNIRDTRHVLCRRRTSRHVCTSVVCVSKLLTYGHLEFVTVENLPYYLTGCLPDVMPGIFVELSMEYL